MNRRTFLTHVGTAAVATPILAQLRAAEKAPTSASPSFISRLQPAVVGGGFELPDHWVWCGAPIRGEDGKYHLFASRIPKTVIFHPHWLFKGKPAHVEDPFLWYENGRVNALMKDMTGEICGEKFGGIHVTSADGFNWDFDRATLAYSRKLRWSDGRTTRQGFLERPQLLIEDGVPTHLFCATAEGPGLDLKDATRTWNTVIPLAKKVAAASAAIGRE